MVMQVRELAGEEDSAGNKLVKQIKEVPVGGRFGWKLIGNADKRSIRRRKIWLETNR